MHAACAVLMGWLAAGPVEPGPHLYTIAEHLRGPARVAVAPDDSLYVTDPPSLRIVHFDAGGNLLDTWSVPDGPVGLAIHPDGRFFVATADPPRVAIYGSARNLLGYLGQQRPHVEFARPIDLAVAPDTGEIFVADAEADRIHVFDSAGGLTLTFGARGNGPGELLYPGAIAVDPVRDRLVVADHDNFRVQCFTTAGAFLFAFGNRLASEPGGVKAWMPRPSGVALDAEGRIYLGDALMNTVRLFEPGGAEVAVVAGAGEEPNPLRTPCDAAISRDGRRLYVVSSNTGSVEVYGVPQGEGSAEGCGAEAAPLVSDLWHPGARRFSRGVPAFRPGSALRASTWDGPHIVEDRPQICWPCHGIPDIPGGHGGTVEGQTALCTSCHNPAGRAVLRPIHQRDLADPFGTHPAAPDGRGRSHAWGVPALNEQAGSVGPAGDSSMAAYLEDGLITCSTCHNQHNQQSGTAYLRLSNDADELCKECHAPYVRAQGEGDSHPVGLVYPAGQDGYPPAGQVAPSVLKDGRVQCLTCHEVHGSAAADSADVAADGFLLRGPGDEVLCRSCHTEHRVHDVAGDWKPTCRECHDSHDEHNRNHALVRQVLLDVPVSLKDRAGVRDLVHATRDTPAYDGVCEACHTETSYHRNTAAGDHAHFADLACTICHPHSAGFLASGECGSCHGEPPKGDRFPDRAGAHDVHHADLRGPRTSDCCTCHPPDTAATHMNGTVSFAAGADLDGDGDIDLSETSVCDECHGAGGPRDGVNDPAVGARNHWYTAVYDGAVLSDGMEQWCAGCHDEDRAGARVQGVRAPDVAGDLGTWGFFAAAHGRSHVVCTDCHDPALAHTDGVAKSFSVRFPLAPAASATPAAERERDRDAYNDGYRLRRFEGMRALAVPREEGPFSPHDFLLCFSCHDMYAVLGVPANYWFFPPPPVLPQYLILPAGKARTNFRNDYPFGWYWHGRPANAHWEHIGFEPADWDVDHDGRYSESRSSCVACHTPHGTRDAHGAPTYALTRGDMGITQGWYRGDDRIYEYAYINSDAYVYPGGDLHCRACHADVGPGEDPPAAGRHTRYYREKTLLWPDECWACHNRDGSVNRN